ncbi:MAG: hypothetical protein K2N88_08650 [Muribaculaceae bacterium]|nr:hypothetical protein [Muribaculaceae bacterium]
MKEDINKPGAAPSGRLRKAMEPVAVVGLLLVAVGLVAPFASMGSPGWMEAFKWIFTAGALAFTAARIAAAVGRGESFRVRRLRRMEAWAGIAFCIAAFFWFYNTRNFSGTFLTFRMLNETIIFTLAGALIQIISSWMLSSALRKEQQ